MGLTFIQPNAAAQPRSSCVEQGAITRGQERWIQRESGLGIQAVDLASEPSALVGLPSALLLQSNECCVWRSHSVVQVGWGELRKHDEQIITVTRCSHSVGIASCRNRSLRRSTTIPSDLRSLLVGSISITGFSHAYSGTSASTKVSAFVGLAKPPRLAKVPRAAITWM